jgi:methylmalonyl-CoA/ethylmalonyl-CoA epimerase
MAKRLHHLGIIVKNLEQSLQLYVDLLGLKPWDKGVMNTPEHGLRVILLPVGDIPIELIEPIGTKSRYARFLKQRGEGLFHICIFTDNYDVEVNDLKKKGIALEEEQARELYPGYTIRIAWVPPESTTGVWIELVDELSHPKIQFK